MVEAMRVGYITARDPKAHRQYLRSRNAPAKGSGLSGEALEQAVMRVAQMFPENVELVAA